LISVSPLQRFDLDQTAPLSAAELQKRWAGFHRTIHTSSPNIPRRLIGPLLGEDTARYRALVRVATLWRVRRRRNDGSSTSYDESAPFPSNFMIDVTTAATRPLSSDARREVLVLVVNEDVASPETMIDTLNESLRATSSTWVMLVSTDTTADERDSALDVMLNVDATGIDVVFADESRRNHASPILKPAGVGPHTLISYNLIGRPALIRTSSLLRIGGFSVATGWAFEHDAFLRIQESEGRFKHVAKVLTGGRPEIAFSDEHVSDATVAVSRAALERRGWTGSAVKSRVAGVSRWTINPPSPLPSIDIVIPTRDRIDLVQRCIQSVERSTYPNFDIIIIDNDSTEQESLEFFESTKYRIVRSPGEFNYAKIVNEGVAQSRAEFVVTLNNDTFILSPDWLERMVGLASLDDVGVVGVTLLDRTGHHEHDGFVITPYPQHLRVGSNYPVVDQYSAATRDVIAVTGAAQMVRRSFWQQLGGMDEHLKVVMNDVDLCLRSQLEGRHVIFCPDVEIIHYAGSSRGHLDPIEDRNIFIARWDIFGTFQDPYVPESLELIGDRFLYRER
jgi:GT2 family glycosyltransferase